MLQSWIPQGSADVEFGMLVSVIVQRGAYGSRPPRASGASRLLAALFIMAIARSRAQDAVSALPFVAEYVREFGAVEHIRLAEERELQAPHQSMVATCIGSGKQYREEITRQIAQMREMSVPPPYQGLPARIVELYGRKVDLYNEVVKACTALSGPAGADVSYVEVTTTVAKYNSRVDAIDRLLFNMSSEVYSTLLSRKQAGHDTARRLAITLAEKQSLVRQIEREFGAELQDDQQTYLVNAASVIHDVLKSHKALDEP